MQTRLLMLFLAAACFAVPGLALAQPAKSKRPKPHYVEAYALLRDGKAPTGMMEILGQGRVDQPAQHDDRMHDIRG